MTAEVISFTNEAMMRMARREDGCAYADRPIQTDKSMLIRSISLRMSEAYASPHTATVVRWRA